jgi:uncharacterized protein YndB with AHSA1/START domain
MATSKVSPDADAIVSEINIAAPPERVFEALTDPKQLVQWWGQKGMYWCNEFQSDLRTGGKLRIAGVDGQGQKFEVTGEYLEIERPRLLAYTWVASWTGDVKTKVRWELEATKEGTLVRIRHSGMAAHPEIAQSYRGWPQLLAFLKALLEKGETVEDRGSARR